MQYLYGAKPEYRQEGDPARKGLNPNPSIVLHLDGEDQSRGKRVPFPLTLGAAAGNRRVCLEGSVGGRRAPKSVWSLPAPA